jgi:anaerobic ribonucleoside-triphosphate reductase activating protein
MYYHQFKIVLQEVPGEISLCFSISGCFLRCDGCHSPQLWKEKSGTLLTKKKFEEYLSRYDGFATCILFMGGEWHEEKLIELLKIAKHNNYKTCLYTGEDEISQPILKHLSWVKTGKWDSKKGGLDNKNTNQKFIQIKTNTILNHLFQKHTLQ